jgi:hypothetical protein
VNKCGKNKLRVLSINLYHLHSPPKREKLGRNLKPLLSPLSLRLLPVHILLPRTPTEEYNLTKGMKYNMSISTEKGSML